MLITDLRGRWAGTCCAWALQPGLGQTPAAVPEVDLEAGDGGLAPGDHHVVHSVPGGQGPPPGDVQLPDQWEVSITVITWRITFYLYLTVIQNVSWLVTNPQWL